MRMNNKRRFGLYPILLLSPLFLLASCKGGDVSGSSEESSNQDGSVSNVENTIGDAYEGDSRPDFGSDFDYETDYTPEEPDDPNYKVVVTLVENSPVKFANGTHRMEVKPNYLFKEEDFDLTGIANDRKIAGVALYTAEDGVLRGTYELSELRAPKKDVTLRPYFSSKEGYLALDIGSGANNKFNFDQVPGSISENRTIKYASDVLVDGGEDGYTEKGVSLTETSRVDINSAMRLDSKSSVMDAQGVYEFVYNFENLGNTPIYLDGYQISASAEYKGKYDYEKRYRMDIDLEPGESKTFLAQYDLGKNGNALTYFVADKTMKEGFSLGMSMSMKKTDLTTVDPKYASSTEEAIMGKVKLSLPEGIQVSNYAENQTAGQPIAIPSTDQIVNTTGKEIAGWYILGESIRYVTSSTFVSDIEEYTIAPYFVNPYGEEIIAGTNSNGTLPDYMGHTLEDGTLDEGDAEMNFKSKDAMINGLRAKNFSSSYSFKKGDYFRLLSASKVTKATKYKFHYSFRNNAETSLSFNLYQVQGGIKISSEEGAVKEEVTLAPKQVLEVEFEIKIQNANSNVMTLFQMKEESNGLNLDIAMAKRQIVEVVKSTLSIEGASGVTFENGQTSVELETGSKMPAIKNETGRTLLGFYNEEGKVSAEDFLMPSNNVTLRPYFAVREGYARLWLGNGKNNGLPNNCSGSLSDGNISNQFVATAKGSGYDATLDSMKTIVKGENGLDEEGILLQSKVDIKTDDAFRMDTIASSTGGKVVTLNKEHSYVYLFENRGENAISFDVWAINSGKDTTSGTNNSFTLTLEAGAFKTIEIKPTFTKGSANGNALTYFKAKTDTGKLNLAVAYSAKFAD